MTGETEPRPKRTILEPDEVHVWVASLNQHEEEIAAFRALLNADELVRADRFTFAKGRRQFTVARGLLRMLLGQYLDTDPTQIEFNYNSYGKPGLAGDRAEQGLQFNLSHSGELVLYALAHGREVGIDVETIRPDFAADAIAARFFAPAERDALKALDPNVRIQAFFDCWTRKEAFIKARGKGLSIGLDTFEVSVDPASRAALLVTHDDPDEATRWALHALAPGPGYAGALAVAGGADCRVEVKTWSDRSHF